MKELHEQATPTRLVFREGKWTLVLEALVRVSDVVFQPVAYEVDGPESILSCLESLAKDENLVKGASEILSRDVDDASDSVVFEAREGGWARSAFDVDALLVRMKEKALKRPRMRSNTSSHQIRSLRRRVSQMVALEKRIAKLEVMERRLAELEERGVAAPQASPSSDEPAGEGGAPLFPPGEEPEEVKGAPLFPEGEEDPDEGDDGEEEQAPEKPALEDEAVPSSMELPSVSDFEEVVQMLAGEDATLTEVDAGKESKLESLKDKFFICTVINDSDVVMGAMVGDLKGTVNLGGGLLMMPQSTLRDQIVHKKASDDVVDALSEIFNTASSLLNDIPGNPHIRTTPCVAFDIAEHEWVKDVAARLDMEENGGGRIILLAKKVEE